MSCWEFHQSEKVLKRKEGASRFALTPAMDSQCIRGKRGIFTKVFFSKLYLVLPKILIFVSNWQLYLSTFYNINFQIKNIWISRQKATSQFWPFLARKFKYCGFRETAENSYPKNRFQFVYCFSGVICIKASMQIAVVWRCSHACLACFKALDCSKRDRFVFIIV